MSGITNLAVGLVGSIVLAALILGFRYYFSPDARKTRRRVRSRGPVVSRKRGPAVKLGLDVAKPGRRRKR